MAAALTGIFSTVLALYALAALWFVVLRFKESGPLAPVDEMDRGQGFRLLGGQSTVTTQLPLYNEPAMAERLLRAVAAMDYPAGQHHIQVLDDSTDGTREIVDRVVAELVAKGISITVLRRTPRTGYKAGALAAGLTQDSSEFTAIFDADFLPPVNFLQRLLPLLLADPSVAFAQARWGHLNANENFLTRAQATNIDAHFQVQQCARASADLLMNFNGSAGIWRRAAIDAAGGWQVDTLTEDLDLSHRSGMAGWRAAYLDDLVVPAEIPRTVAAYRQQQFRWAKGSTQTLFKLAPRLWRSQLPIYKKVLGTLHEGQYLLQPLLLLHCLAAPWLLGQSMLGGSLMMLAAVLTAVVPMVNLTSKQTPRLLGLASMILLGSSLAWTGTKAFLSACCGPTGEFTRTPKGAGISSGGRTAAVDSLVEIALGLYAGFTYLRYVGPWGTGSLGVLLMHAGGFLWLGLRGLWEVLPAARKESP